MAGLIQEVGLYLPTLLRGAGWTLALSLASAVGGVALGLCVCAGRLSLTRILSTPARVFISVIRGTPLLLQLFYIYYGLPEFGVVLPAFAAGVLGLSVNLGAYLAELFRGALQALDTGQRQAAQALGLSRSQAFFLVIAPQAVRNTLPALGNYALVLVKESSLVATISVLELMRSGELLANATFRVLVVYTLVGVIYYAICSFVAALFSVAEKRMSIPGNYVEAAAIRAGPGL